MINPFYFLQNDYPVLRKAAVIIFISLIIFSCADRKNPDPFLNDLYFDNLTGGVKTVEETPYTINDSGQISAIDSCCITITEYDNKGYRSRQINKDINGHEKNGQIYVSRYNNGKPKEIRFTQNGKLTSILSAIIDKMGKYGNTRIYDSSGKLEYYYSGIEVNEYGKIILMKKITLDSILQQTIVNNYNKQIWVGGFIKDSSGKEIFSTTIHLNEKMNPVEVKQTTILNSLPVITTTRYLYNLYDAHSNWIESTEMDEKGTPRKISKRKITYRNE